MNYALPHTFPMSKITERGQITLPKRVREATLFKHARAVVFEEQGDVLLVRPVAPVLKQDEHIVLLDTTMRDWSDPKHDDLFDFTPL